MDGKHLSLNTFRNFNVRSNQTSMIHTNSQKYNYSSLIITVLNVLKTFLRLEISKFFYRTIGNNHFEAVRKQEIYRIQKTLRSILQRMQSPSIRVCRSHVYVVVVRCVAKKRSPGRLRYILSDSAARFLLVLPTRPHDDRRARVFTTVHTL